MTRKENISMANFAELVVGVNTRGLVKGEKALNDTTRAAGKTERAVDETGRAFTKAGAKSKASTSAMSKGMKGAAAAAATMVVAALGIGKSISVIRDFESSVSKMGAISGATTLELQAMRDVAKDLGSTTEFSATQAADGLSFLAMAGFDAAESIAAIPAVLDLATAAGMGLAEAADTTSNIMSGFGIEAADAANVTDILAAASTRANTDVAQLGAAMSTVAPIANSLNIGLEETAASIGVMSDAGIQGERAGTALRGVLASLSGPTSQATEALAGLGLSIADVDPATNSLAGIMAKLETAGLSTAEAMTIFGREAASGALVMVKGADRLRDFTSELGKVDGAAKDMATTMRDNLGGDIDGLVSALSGLAIALGEAGLTAVLRGLIQGLTAITRVMADLVTPAFQALAFVLTTLAATQIPMVLAGFVTMTAGMTTAGIATGIFTGAVRLANIALVALGGPLGMIWGVLGAGAAAWVLWGGGAKHGEVAAYDAADANEELMFSLSEFALNVSPAAAASAIDMANANHTLATSAYDAARAELVKRRAMLGLLGASPGENSMVGRRVGQTAPALAAEVAALEEQTRAEANLAAAERDRVTAVTAVTGALSEQMTQSIGSTNANRDMSLSLDANISGLGGVTDAADELADKLEGPLASAIDGVSNAFGDWMARGFTDFKSFAKSIFREFQNMLSQMISTAIANPIKIAIMGGGAAGGSGILSGAIGSMGTGAMGGMAGLAGGSGIMGGLGNTLAGTFGAGGGIGGLVGSIGGEAGIMSSIGAALPIIGIAVAVFSFFKKKTKLLDEGIKATIDMENAMFESFKKIQTSRFFGLSKKTSVETTKLNDEQASPFNDAVGLIQDSVVSATNSLGVSSDVFSNFTHEFELSLKGMDDAAKHSAILGALDGLADAMAGSIGGLSDFAKEGESSMATLSRLSTSLAAVNIVLDTLQHNAFEASLQTGAFASDLIDQFGGLDALNAQTSGYFMAFYSDAERLSILTGQVSDEFAALGVTMPITRDGYRDLIEAQDLTTESGRQVYASLISLHGAMGQIIPVISGLDMAVSDAMQGVTDSIGAAIDRIMERTGERLSRADRRLSLTLAVQDRARRSIKGFIDDITENTVNKFSAMRDAIRSALDARGPISQAGNKAAFSRASNDLRGFAQSGSFSQDQLGGALDGISGDNSQFFGNQADFAFDSAKTNAALRSLEGQTTAKLTDAERQIETLEALIEIDEAGFETLSEAIRALERSTAREESILRHIEKLEEFRDLRLEKLDEELMIAQEQSNFLLGIDVSVKSVRLAIAGLSGAMSALASSQAASNKLAAEKLKTELEQAKKQRESNDESKNVVKELRAVKANMAQMVALNRSIAVSTGKSSKLQKKFDVDGMPETRTA